MSRKKHRDRKAKYLENNYAAPLLAMAPKTPGVFNITVLHDDWCAFLAGKGPCNCNPEIRKRRVTPFRNDHRTS